MSNENKDPLAPARAVIYWVPVGIILWIVVGIIVWAVWFR